VSELRSAVEQLRAEVLGELPDARLEEDLTELHRAVEHLELERLRRLAELDRRRLYERDGHLSGAGWMVRHLGMGWGAAREQVRLARGLDQMPRTRQALEEGGVSLGAARVLAAARLAEPEAFASAEELLVETARRHSVADLGRVVAFWREQVAAERLGDPEERRRARRRLHASVLLDGMVRVDGDLDPEAGEALLTALRSVMDAEAKGPGARGDPRTAAQRRADALGEICRGWLDRADRPQVGGERPHLTLTMGIETLRGGLAAIHDGTEGHDTSPTLDHTGPTSVATARRFACDAALMRVVLDGASQPLDVGRRTKIVSPGLRRAVIVRDRTCRFPGCGRPHPWCDAHHVRHWADGGETALGNLLLLCRPHHRLVHRPRGFSLAIEELRPVFRRPDGSVLADGATSGGRAPP
jgi:hypothetical protein